MKKLRTSAIVRSLGNGAAARYAACLGAAGACAVGALLAHPSPAAAQAPPPQDVKFKQPNMLLLLDTSGSMAWAPDPSQSVDCDDSWNPVKSRWAILVETLTGTVNNLDCGGSDVIESNDCSPRDNTHPSITGALSSDPYAWPYHTGGGKNKLPIGFRKSSSGGWCSYLQSGEWDQQNDGIVDIFGDKIRFGLMTFDGVDLYRRNFGWPYFNEDAPATEHAPLSFMMGGTNWNALTQPPGSYPAPVTASSFDPPASYWFTTTSNWLSGPPTSYAGQIYIPSISTDRLRQMGYTSWGVCSFYPATPPHTGYLCPQTAFDVGVKNSRAQPWMGRLIGFGDPDASVADTVAHNDMVQLASIGVSKNLVGSTPLAAMMRDAYEFLLIDDQTDGVTIPHLNSDPAPKIKISPSQDTYVYGTQAGCRQQYVLAITDGEPTGDLVTETMGEWAEKLYSDSVASYGVPTETFIIGVGLDTATWTPGAPVDTTTTSPKDCATLLDADRGAGGMCERYGGDPTETRWRYADECTPAGAVYNGAGPNCIEGDLDDTLTNTDRSAIRACCNILDVAIRGRDPSATDAQPYFPKTQAELKGMMSALISKIAGGTLSRTTPGFAAASASTVAGSASAASYELRSALTVPPGNNMWVGTLERVRWTCGGGTQAMTRALGDDFAANLADNAPNARYFFTVSPHTTEANPEGSIRPRQTSQSSPDPNVDDCLFECSTTNVGDTYRLGGATGPGNDVLQHLNTLKTAIDSTSGMDADEMLDLQGTDRAGCEAVVNNGNSLGGGWRNTCASAILEWYGGDPNPTGPTTPTRHPDPSGFELRSPLGGIYKSVPVVVEPPKPIEEDELFSNERTAPAADTDSFVKEYGARPTMVYAQSVDGQLHAFVLNANATTGTWGAPSNVPRVDSLMNNELWTFIPPAVMPSLFRNFNVHARLADGPISYANVAFSRDPSNGSQVVPWRTMADVQNGKGEYKTVLVVSSGPSVIGGFYYALDVTDPLRPRFLWQLSSAGEKKDERRDLFGDSVPGAAITTLRLKEPGRGERMVPVAILAGGSRNASPTGVIARRMDPASYWDGVGHRPRQQIRNWGDSEAARSITVVELYSGRIIMRLGGRNCDTAGPGCSSTDTGDHPLQCNDPPTCSNVTAILDPDVVLPASGQIGFFDSPMSGQPVVYPSGAGKVATRAYVGDQDGTMWRINLSDPDPKQWTAEIAFDAYNFDGPGDHTMSDARIEVGAGAPGSLGVELSLRGISTAADFAVIGSPITTTPLISTDEFEQTTVSFATGDAETFQLASTNAVNMLITFVDRYDATDVRFEPYVNDRPPGAAAGDPYQGIEMAFLDGASVTGPLNLFDGQLIFSYFVPQTGTACTFGQGGWCAAHYLKHAAAGIPDAVMDLNGSGGPEICDAFTGPGYTGDEVVFGIQVNQKPSCQPAPTTFPDPWLAGSYTSITTSTVGNYEIVMFTGQGGGTEHGAATKSARRSLNTPRSSTSVRSWVNAIE
ncbi:MAG: hypothetical protein JNL21_15910 [Myxococcales bacterium]|nr:hypothetical protein [Myxococcales bacterium]